MPSPAGGLAAQQRPADDLAGRERVLPALGLAERRDVEQVERAVDAAHGGDPLTRRLDGVFAERELVELPDALPAALTERVEELQGLREVHRADDQVVVPAAEVVVDVDAVEQAARVNEPGGLGR